MAVTKLVQLFILQYTPKLAPFQPTFDTICAQPTPLSFTILKFHQHSSFRDRGHSCLLVGFGAQFGIGTGAPMEEISKMAVQNMAVARQVFDDSHVSDVLAGFFDEYATPLIWNNKFNYNGAEHFDCSSTNLYLDQELVCIGQLEDACSKPELEIPGLGQLLADDDMFKVSLHQCSTSENKRVLATQVQSAGS